MTHPTILRQRNTQAVVDQFKDRPFQWGEVDCVRIAAADLKLSGYETPLFSRMGRWTSEKGALRALARVSKAAGAERPSLVAVMSALGLFEIAPADVLPGDLVGTHADAPWDISLGVAVGGGQLLGVTRTADESGVCTIGNMTVWDRAAWRVEPCPS